MVNHLPKFTYNNAGPERYFTVKGLECLNAFELPVDWCTVTNNLTTDNDNPIDDRCVLPKQPSTLTISGTTLIASPTPECEHMFNHSYSEAKRATK